MPKKTATDLVNVKKLLAVYLLNNQEGNRLKSVRDLAKIYNVSIGLISQAISSLETDGGVEIRRRGHLGSFLVKRSAGTLWEIAENSPVVVALTLPSNRRFEGLATGIKQLFSQQNVNTYFVFIRGSRTRLHILKEQKCNIAIMSAFATNGLCTQNEEIALSLPRGTFVKEHMVFYRTKPPKTRNHQYVAIDYDSYDQSHLTKLEFARKDVKFREITFMNIYRYLKEGLVDATVGTKDDLIDFVGNGIACRPLSAQIREEVKEQATSATLVIRSNDIFMRTLVQEILDPSVLLAIQQSVVEGNRIPEY